MRSETDAPIRRGVMANSEIRFGLVGFGAWGKFHAAAIAKTSGASLRAIAVTSETSRGAAREAYPDAEVFADYRELVARTDLDVVDVVVPSHLHHEVASALLAGGKHVLLEKPMAVSLQECDELIELARTKDLLLAIGHELRLSSLWSRVKGLIESGYVGEPQYALIELSRKPYRHGSQGWRYDIRRVGNWILEEPIHFFDLARWYFQSLGEPQTVYATANSRQSDHPELQDNFSAVVHFPRGAYAVVSQTLSAFEHHQTVKISGTKGALWAAWSGATDRTLHPQFSLRAFDGERVVDMPIEKITGEVFELEDQMSMLIAAIRDGRPLACTAEDGRQSVAMCLAAQRSVEAGEPVALDAPTATS